MLDEKQGFVSIWVGTLAKKADLAAYLKETYHDDDETPISRFAADCGAVFYDHDGLEWKFAGARPLPLSELLAKHSWADSYADEADKLGQKAEVSTANAVIVFYDRVLRPRRWPKDVPLKYIGELPFSQLAVPKYQPLEKVRGHKQRVMRIVFAPQEPLAATGDDAGTLLAWDVASGYAVSQVQAALEDSVDSLTFSADGRRLVAGTMFRQTRLWNDFPADKSLGPLVEVECQAVADDARQVLEGQDDHVQVADLATGKERPKLRIAAGRVRALPGNRLAGLDDEGLLTIWDLATKKQLAKSPSPLEEFDDFRAAVGGKLVVGWYNEELAGFDIQRKRWWRGEAKENIRHLDPGTANLGVLVAGQLELWDWTTGKRLKAFGTPRLEYYDIALSRDGKLAVAVDNDHKSAELWDPSRGKLLATIPAKSLGQKEAINAAQISPDQQTIAVGTFSGRVAFFRWDGKKVTPARPL